MPDGWDHQYDGIDDESGGFCPKHSSVKPFTDHQCTGCVSGWGDCQLWRDFAYSGRRNLSPGDFASLERGICPRRINGTFGVSPLGVERIDLSSEERRSGIELAAAIRDYWIAYPEKQAS